MSDLFTSTEMDGQSAVTQATKAIRNTLVQIKENPVVGYHLGLGTKTFGLLTEALGACWKEAGIHEHSIEEIRRSFLPNDPEKIDSRTKELMEDILAALNKEMNGNPISYSERDDFIYRLREVVNS